MLRIGKDGRNLFVSTRDWEFLEEWRKMLAIVGEETHRVECPACVAGLRRSFVVPVSGDNLPDGVDTD